MIGLGLMGHAMARRLTETGHAVSMTYQLPWRRPHS
jgi:3-hydroxyisobutyrate dehydrogenase-like beta-hydroxyacid dehydrogenase